MKLPIKERFSSAAIVVALTAVLLALAVLQYRWSSEVSDATSTRMRANLHASLTAFRMDLYHELSAVCVAFQVNPGADPADQWMQYAQHYRQWSRTAAHPRLVANVYVWKDVGSERPQFQRLATESAALEDVPWPSNFASLRDVLGEFSSLISTGFQHHRVADSEAEHRLFMPSPRPGLVPWAIEQSIPALVHPVFEPVVSTGTPTGQNRAEVSWIIIELNVNVFRDEIFRELADRYFSGPDGYRIAVTTGEERQTIYSSDADFNATALANADESMLLFGGPTGAGGPGPNLFLAPDPPPLAMNRSRDTHIVAGTVHFLPLRVGSTVHDWTVVAQHRNGSLESSVAALRRRSLAISFGVLLVLAATMAIIVITSKRAQRLAKLQMDFVAAVSHELRTPLTVISSAADNIADGVVNNQQQVKRYGSVIKNQARQLIQLVEQVLLFASTGRHAHHYNIRRVEVTQVIDAALESTAGLVQAAGVSVRKEVQLNLPPIEADVGAVSHCLQNLITNAVKYGGQGRWLGICALLVPNNGAGEIQIRVEDRGVGIPAQELNDIFEPFYRSASASAAQIHGTGLGLPLAKRIAEDMNGRLTVSSECGKGSTFVLHFPPSVSGDGKTAGAYVSANAGNV